MADIWGGNIKTYFCAFDISSELLLLGLLGLLLWECQSEHRTGQSGDVVGIVLKKKNKDSICLLYISIHLSIYLYHELIGYI